MKLLLIRKTFTELSTIGSLYIDGIFFCYVIEDKDRGLSQKMSLTEIALRKIWGKTAIPYGTYKVIISRSTRFRRDLPEILSVKGFEGVRVHRGNTAEDSSGCLIVGNSVGKNSVFNSTVAEEALLRKLRTAQGEITLDIIK